MNCDTYVHVSLRRKWNNFCVQAPSSRQNWSWFNTLVYDKMHAKPMIYPSAFFKTIYFRSAFNTNTPEETCWKNWTLWASVPHSATGYRTSSQTDPRQFGLAVTPPLLIFSTTETLRAVCSAPSRSPCTPMTAWPHMEKVCRWHHHRWEVLNNNQQSCRAGSTESNLPLNVSKIKELTDNFSQHHLWTTSFIMQHCLYKIMK